MDAKWKKKFYEWYCVCVIHSLNNIPSDGKRTSVKSTASEGSTSLLSVDIKNFKATWNEEVQQNREKWKALAAKGDPHKDQACGDSLRCQHTESPVTDHFLMQNVLV